MFLSPSRFLKLSLWLVAGFALTGCGLRLDTPPDALPELDAGQAGISAVSRAEAAIGVGSEKMANDASLAPGVREVIGTVRDLSATRLAALGGVWQPWPQGTPEGANPGPQPSPAPGSVEDLIQLLVDTAATSCQAGARAPHANDAQLLTALCAAQQLDASHVAGAAGHKLPEPTVPVDSLAGTNPEGSTEPIADRKNLQNLIEAQTALDFARFRMEVAAAHLSGNDRQWALQRADSLAWDVQSLVDGGVEDVRAAQYALDFSQIKTTPDAIRLINQADADAFAAHLKIIELISPTGAASKKSPDQALSALRQPWISAAKGDVTSQNRFGVPPSQIFVQLWP